MIPRFFFVFHEIPFRVPRLSSLSPAHLPVSAAAAVPALSPLLRCSSDLHLALHSVLSRTALGSAHERLRRRVCESVREEVERQAKVNRGERAEESISKGSNTRDSLSPPSLHCVVRGRKLPPLAQQPTRLKQRPQCSPGKETA